MHKIAKITEIPKNYDKKKYYAESDYMDPEAAKHLAVGMDKIARRGIRLSLDLEEFTKICREISVELGASPPQIDWAMNCLLSNYRGYPIEPALFQAALNQKSQRYYHPSDTADRLAGKTALPRPEPSAEARARGEAARLKLAAWAKSKSSY